MTNVILQVRLILPAIVIAIAHALVIAVVVVDVLIRGSNMKKNYTIAVLISSYTCNLNCEFCRLSEINQKFGRHKDLMSVETLDDIIEREMPGAFVVTGGEPFLNMQLLMALKDKKAATKINTNGTIIWPDTEWPSNFRLNISESGHGYTPLYQ